MIQIHEPMEFIHEMERLDLTPEQKKYFLLGNMYALAHENIENQDRLADRINELAGEFSNFSMKENVDCTCPKCVTRRTMESVGLGKCGGNDVC